MTVSENSISTVTGECIVRKSAPEWSSEAVLASGEISTISSKDFEGKFLVLLFYPLDFTFVCPTELIGYSEAYEQFEALNASVVGISVDSVYSHLAWTMQKRSEGGLGKMNIPLVSDLSKSISRSFQVLVDGDKATRGLFIIDPKGVVRHATINDLPIGRNVEETLRVIEAIQFHDEHGEVCPLNWKKGDKTMNPDPVASKQYFRKRFKADE